jgi:hypothetical protein
VKKEKLDDLERERADKGHFGGIGGILENWGEVGNGETGAVGTWDRGRMANVQSSLCELISSSSSSLEC